MTDFDNLPPLPTADHAICTLGTTIKAAGSRAAFKAVDKTAVLAFAEASRQAGVSHFLIVTAVGADPKSSVFYSRVKGEAEAGLAAMGFRRLDILRPGLLLGERTETRRVEQLLQRLAPVTDHLMPGPWQGIAVFQPPPWRAPCWHCARNKSPAFTAMRAAISMTWADQ